ncbi:Cytochrome P450, partial [Dillenia turbinata]
QPLHRTLYSLSTKYGPIFSLQFGFRPVLVVSSPSAVEECFTENDIAFANRPNCILGKHLGYNYTTMVSASYGDHWRNLRRLSSLEIFSSSRLNMFSGIRKDEIMQLVVSLYSVSGNQFGKVELKSKFSELSFNIIMRMISGQRYYGNELADFEETKKFKEIIREFFEMAGASNPADFLPFLRWFDFQSLEKRMKTLAKNLDIFLQGLVDKHKIRKNENNNTMIDHLLSLQEKEPEYYKDEIIKGLILLWVDPLSFKPDRFENEKTETYKLIPYGFGRRSCPGAVLGNRIVGLTLGTLVQCFEWERIGKEKIDMTEGFGLTMPKVKPLVAMCRVRPAMKAVLASTLPPCGNEA